MFDSFDVGGIGKIDANELGRSLAHTYAHTLDLDS